MKKILELQPKDFMKGLATGEHTGDGIFKTLEADIFISPRSFGTIQPPRVRRTLKSSCSDTLKAMVQRTPSEWYAIGDEGYLYVIGRTSEETLVIDSGHEADRYGGSGIISYKEKLHYFYNNGCGTFDFSSTFTNDVYTINITADDHPVLVFQDVLFFGNGQYIGEIDNTTLNARKIDLGDDYKIKDIKVYNNYIAILATDERGTSNNPQYSKLFLWDGYSDNVQFEYPINEICTALEQYRNDLMIFSESVMFFSGGSFEVLKELENTVNVGQTYCGRNMVYWVDDGFLYSYGSPTSKISPSVQTYFQISDNNALISNCDRNRNEFIVASDDIYIYNTSDDNYSFETVEFSLDHLSVSKIVLSFDSVLQSGDDGQLDLYINGNNQEFKISYTKYGAVKYIEIITETKPIEFLTIEFNGQSQFLAPISKIKLYGNNAKRPA